MTDRDQRRVWKMQPGSMPPGVDNLFGDDDMPEEILIHVVMLRPDMFEPGAIAATEQESGGMVGGGMSIQLNCHPLFAAESLRGAADAIEQTYRAAAAAAGGRN